MKIISLLVAAAIVLPVNTLAAAAAPKEPDYFCYMRTSTGKILDLTFWCRSDSQTLQSVEPIVSTPSKDNKKIKLEIAGIEAKFQKNITGDILPKAPLLATGQITNLSNERVSVGNITAMQGTSLIQIQADLQLNPGQKATFQDAAIHGRPSLGIIDDVQSWADLYGSTYTDGFAACQFISNVNEKEKHCLYH